MTIKYIDFLNLLTHFQSALTNRFLIINFIWDNNKILRDYFGGNSILVKDDDNNERNIWIGITELTNHFRTALVNQNDYIIQAMWDNNMLLKLHYCGYPLEISSLNVNGHLIWQQQQISLSQHIEYFKEAIASNNQYIIQAMWVSSERLQINYPNPSSIQIQPLQLSPTDHYQEKRVSDDNALKKESISFDELQQSITLKTIDAIAVKHKLPEYTAEMVFSLLKDNFKFSTHNFKKNLLIIHNVEVFILALLETLKFGNSICIGTEEQKFKNLQIIPKSCINQKTVFINKISPAIDFNGAKNQKELLLGNLFSKSTAWSIIQYIKSNSDGFPIEFYRPTLEEANTSFSDLYKQINGMKITFKPINSINTNFLDSNQYWDQLLQNSHPFNFGWSTDGRVASNYFTINERSLTYKGAYTPVDTWEKKPVYLAQWLGNLINEQSANTDKAISHHKIKHALSRDIMVCQFSPLLVAEAINLLIKNGYIHSVNTIFDPIGGWGERLVGSLAYFVSQGSKLKNPVVISNDANPELSKNYNQLFNHFKKLYPVLSNSVSFKAFNKPIENLSTDEIFAVTDNKRLDMAITSPPYYGDGGVIEGYPLHRDKNNETQQSSQYTGQQDWTENFYRPFICKVLTCSWHFFLNVPAEKAENYGKGRKAVYSYFTETKNAMMQFEKQTGFKVRFVNMGTYNLSGSLIEAMYLMKVFEPLIFIKPLFFPTYHTDKNINSESAYSYSDNIQNHYPLANVSQSNGSLQEWEQYFEAYNPTSSSQTTLALANNMEINPEHHWSDIKTTTSASNDESNAKTGKRSASSIISISESNDDPEITKKIRKNSPQGGFSLTPSLSNFRNSFFNLDNQDINHQSQNPDSPHSDGISDIFNQNQNNNTRYF